MRYPIGKRLIATMATAPAHANGFMKDYAESPWVPSGSNGGEQQSIGVSTTLWIVIGVLAFLFLAMLYAGFRSM